MVSINYNLNYNKGMNEERVNKNIVDRGGQLFLKRWTVLDVPETTVEAIKSYSDTENVSMGRALTELIYEATENKTKKEIIGLDYWQVISHYGEYFKEFATQMLKAGHEIHIITAVGADRATRVFADIDSTGVPYTAKHKVVFKDPIESPRLKLEKCQEIGITVFYDDRDDVCRMLNKNGIVAMRVTRKDNSTYDLESEIK